VGLVASVVRETCVVRDGFDGNVLACEGISTGVGCAAESSMYGYRLGARKQENDNSVHAGKRPGAGCVCTVGDVLMNELDGMCNGDGAGGLEEPICVATRNVICGSPREVMNLEFQVLSLGRHCEKEGGLNSVLFQNNPPLTGRYGGTEKYPRDCFWNNGERPADISESRAERGPHCSEMGLVDDNAGESVRVRKSNDEL
jgi:hypothetical protein